MNNTSICPCCGNKLRVTKYTEDIWGSKEIVEVDAKCGCGYHYNKAYGREAIEYPEETQHE